MTIWYDVQGCVLEGAVMERLILDINFSHIHVRLIESGVSPSIDVSLRVRAFNNQGGVISAAGLVQITGSATLRSHKEAKIRDVEITKDMLNALKFEKDEDENEIRLRIKSITLVPKKYIHIPRGNPDERKVFISFRVLVKRREL